MTVHSATLPVLFLDLDDTIVNSSAAYNHGMHAIGIEPNDLDYLRAREQTKCLLPKLAPQSHSRFLYFKTYLENRGEYTPALHLSMAYEYEAAVLNFLEDNWNFLNRESLFLKLRTLYSFIHILTNEMTRIQVHKLRVLDPNFMLFDRVTTSEDVGFEKPDHSIFNHALQVSNVKPSQVIMVGDSFDNDIRPALELGIKPILTTEFSGSTKLERGIAVIKSLEELLLF